MIYKDPVTDDGLKKSQKGKVFVYHDLEKKEPNYIDNLTIDPKGGLLKTIFLDGRLCNETSLIAIRKNLNK